MIQGCPTLIGIFRTVVTISLCQNEENYIFVNLVCFVRNKFDKETVLEMVFSHLLNFRGHVNVVGGFSVHIL